ncbi:MAG: carbamoyltransferase C-terminal domain-containing protein [Gammaproteobacteria bacterium]|nr:carbamoyltransferase C-terminal domain-containing protein [Gammaproteobacteria bacterium]
MTKITLGLSGSVGHDPAAAVFIDGELIAAIEEERLIRKKHAKGELPYHAAIQCMKIAGVRGSDVNHIAIPYAPTSLFSRARWHYAYRHWYAPDRTIDSIFNGNRRYRRYLRELHYLAEQLQISGVKRKLIPVPHQLSHASSCYHLNESDEKTAIFCVDSKGEYSNIFLGYGEKGRIVKIKEFFNPDSLCGMYAALTDYLGFETLDGEFKVMGVSPFGDPQKYDFSSLAYFDGADFRVNTKLISTVGFRRYKAKSKGHYFSKKLVEMLGPRRVGNLFEDPYVHYAASIQKLYEDLSVDLVNNYLGDILKETGRLAVSGTGSMNIRLNQRLSSIPEVRSYTVNPTCSDAGTAIGAASFALRDMGLRIKPLKNVYLGPAYDTDQCITACLHHPEKPYWEIIPSPHKKAAELLANGQPVAWFRGRMEFGVRSLGNRSIFASPSQAGITDAINQQVKFRESRRRFSPSVIDSVAKEFLPRDKQDQFMCMSLPVSMRWRERYPEVIYADGTTRAQVVTKEANEDLYTLLAYFQELTGHGLLINTALSRPGEALACSPEDALNVFIGTDLNYLILGNVLVTKRQGATAW